MTDKEEDYYTPEIEEFHVGFEYEFQGVDCNWRPTGWEKVTQTQKGNSYGAFGNTWLSKFKNIESSYFRVKYLDKEDIESLGFVYDHTNKDLVDKFLERGYTDDDTRDRQWVFYKGNLCLFYYPKSKELGTFTRDPSKSHFMMKYSRDNHMISTLIVKNKSELKRILKQQLEIWHSK